MKQLKIRWGFKLPSPTGKIVYQTQLYHFINLSSDEAMKIKKVTRKQINAFLEGDLVRTVIVKCHGWNTFKAVNMLMFHEF